MTSKQNSIGLIESLPEAVFIAIPVMTLFTPFYSARIPVRQKELEECLRINAACESIDRIVLLIDDDHHPKITNSKLEIVRIRSRPTYRDWIDLTRAKASQDVSILANSDISFDASLSNLEQILLRRDTFVCLSRHEKRGSSHALHPNPHWSQDVWALGNGAHLSDALYRALDVPLGVPRCDNKIAYLFAIHGWEIHNPAHFVKALHHHESDLRGYNKKQDTTVLGGVAYVHTSEVLAAPSRIEIDVWSKSAEQIVKVSLNRSLQKHLEEAANTTSTGAVETPRNTPSSAAGGVSGSGCRPLSVPRLDSTGLLRRKDIVFDHNKRFVGVQNGDVVELSDSLIRKHSCVLAASDFQHWTSQNPPLKLLSHFIPNVLNLSPSRILQRPSVPDDPWFWQYPCLTEKQAYDNHAALTLGRNVCLRSKTINIYVGIPWATFIDMKKTPASIFTYLRPRLLGYKSLAARHDFNLAVHTVCQSIHWRRILNYCDDLGITDLHLSHCEQPLHAEFTHSRLRLHSWPLYAVNVEAEDRREGIVIGKPIQEKRYLASFMGAHMKHYRSDVRLRLAALQKGHHASDIFIKLGDTWNFNQIVFGEQIGRTTLSPVHHEEQRKSAKRYNQILSDSVFSLCPEGAGPNTLRFWESLAIGAIPVVISDTWQPPPIELNGMSLRDCFIRVPSKSLESLFPLLRSLDLDTVADMQKHCILIYQKAAKLTCF